MATPELLKSWEVTEQHLRLARSFLPPEVVALHALSLSQFAEFLDHNELGLAFDCLDLIARESQWSSIALLESLELAALNMKRDDDAHPLRCRINELSGQQ